MVIFLDTQMGFDSLYFARLDYVDKATRIAKDRMEQVWHTSQSLGSTSDLFFGALFAHYGPPKGFCFDTSCNDPPIMVRHPKSVNLAFLGLQFKSMRDRLFAGLSWLSAASFA